MEFSRSALVFSVACFTICSASTLAESVSCLKAHSKSGPLPISAVLEKIYNAASDRKFKEGQGQGKSGIGNGTGHSPFSPEAGVVVPMLSLLEGPIHPLYGKTIFKEAKPYGDEGPIDPTKAVPLFSIPLTNRRTGENSLQLFWS